MKALAFFLALAALPANAQRGAKPLTELAPAVRESLTTLLASHDAPADRWLELHRSAWSAQGDAAPLIQALEAVCNASDPEERRDALRALAFVLHREGRLEDALKRTDEALAIRSSDELVMLRAQLLDALDRADEALAAYEGLRTSTTDTELAGRIGLRVALLQALRGDKSNSDGANTFRTIGNTANALRAARASGVRIVSVGGASAPATETSTNNGGGDSPPSALFRFASEDGREAEFRNRAAVVLALLARPKEAIQLFQTAGEGSDLFRQEIRLAEWALAAKEPKDAQEHAWRAREAATLKRDRLYALTVLVEAHRADSTLPALIERFASAKELDDDSRRVWIDLLRETARIDEALELFRRSGEGAFTPEMRRELLEMCREAGREEELVATYRDLIANEPERIEWREGLARDFLERGRREDAEAVWQSYLDSFNDVPHALEAARTTRDLGLDDFARRCAERCLDQPSGTLEARMFLFDFEVRRGRVEAALEELEAFDKEAAPDSPLRIQLAEAFERIGNKKRAADVLEGIRTVRGADEAEEDLEMRLAWLLSEVGEEDAALERWRNLWKRVSSLPRRRQVEDRLMAVASRLGKLSDIAVELEEKLADGKADDRDAGLLVRLYTKVGDPVSAAEVVEEHMQKSGADPVATLTEKARVFVAGKDFYHYEKTVRKLLEVDPENKADHLRQLAMSNLERGKPQEARAVLSELAQCESPSDAAEFEAGVLALAGLNDDAVRTYRRGLGDHPERIDTYLLLANTMKALGQTERAIGMFQYLAENADKDDLFTIAIDGLLNMRAKAPALRWALRVTLERLAGRHDKMYLYQLCSDLSEELKDNDGKLRALESSLAIAGEQRAQILRELMDVAQGEQSNTWTIVNGQAVQRRVGGDDKRRLAYGRRLIGLGDVVPPQVYLELGEAFLHAGEISNASKTFSMARDVPDYSAFQRQVAQSFEQERFVEQALAIYERAMASSGADVSLLLKVGELHEQLGHDERAAELYARGIELLLARHPLSVSLVEKKEPADDQNAMFGWGGKNIGDFEKYFGPLQSGFVAAANGERARAIFDAQRALLEADLREASAVPAEPDKPKKLAGFPRLEKRAEFLRHVALRFEFAADSETIDLALLGAFAQDDDLLAKLCEPRAKRGLTAAAKELVDKSGRSEELRKRALSSLAIGTNTSERGALTLADAVSRLLPVLIEGDRERASVLLRSVQVGEVKKEDLQAIQLVLSAALFLDDDGAIVQLGRTAVRAIVQNAQDWQEQQQLGPLLKRIRAAVDRESFGLVVDALLEALDAKKEKFQSYSDLLVDLQRDLGRPLFEAEKLRKHLEDCFPDEPWIGASLIELAPLEGRKDLLQGVWPKVPPTSRAYLATQTLSQCGDHVPSDLAEFLIGAFEEGLDKLDEPESLTYELREGAQRSGETIPVLARMAELAAKKFPANLTFAAVQASAQEKTGKHEAALASMHTAVGLIPQEEQEWNAREASSLLVDAFVPGSTDALLAEIDALDGGNAKAAQLATLRTEIFDKLGDPARKIAALERAVQRDPDSVDALRSLYYAVSGTDDVPRSLELLERLTDKDKGADYWRNYLQQRWLALRNPVRALAAKKKGETADSKDAEGEAKKLEPATIVAVKKAVDEKRVEDARALFRRTWRRYGAVNSSPFIIYSYWGSSELEWPSEPKQDPSERTKGGIDELGLDKKEEERKPGRSAYEVVAELAFGPDELAKEVRSLNENELQRSRAILRGLQHAEVRTRGAEQAVAHWLDLAKRGHASTIERALLLSYFEDHLQELKPSDRAILADLVPAVHPLDGAQLRALARIHAKLGETTRASRIYQWCATLATSNRWNSNNSISAHDLLEEVPKHLSGDDLTAAIDAILARCDPGGSLWERDEFVSLVIETWRKTAGAQKALGRCREQLDAVLELSRGILREAAFPAARVYAETGDVDHAVRALEIALAKFEAGQVHFDRDDSYAMRWKLQPQGLSYPVRDLFPATLGDAARDVDWLTRARDALLEWDRADRLQPDASRTLLVAVAVRLHEKGRDSEALALLDRIEEKAAKRPGQRHLVIDLSRMLGREERARQLEDELLAANSLNPERVADVIKRVKAASGAQAAFDAASKALEWTPSPELVTLASQLATEIGKQGEVERCAKLESDSKAAAKELDTTW